MHLAIDIRSLTDEAPTGVATYTKKLVTALATAAPEWQFSLFASGSTHARSRLPHFPFRNVTMRAVSMPNKLLAARLLSPFGPALEDYLEERPQAWLFPKFDVIATRLPYLLTIHDVAFRMFPEFITRKERWYQKIVHVERLLRQANRLLAVSQTTAQDITRYFGVNEEKISVTPLGLDHDQYRSREQPSDKAFRATYDLNRPYILSLATQEPRKNLESVLEAYAIYRQDGGLPLPLVLVGAPGWKTRILKGLLAKHPYKQDVWRLGYLPEKHKPAVIRGASLLLFPSFYEGFGLPALEAAACETTVITSLTGSLPEVMADCAIYVDPFNVNDLAQALSQVIQENDSLAFKNMRHRAIERARLFSWEKTAITTLAAVKSVIR